MPASQSLPPFRFPPTFFVNHVHRLPTSARGELIRFLKALQENPLSPDFFGEKEDCGDRHACEFHYGFVIFWKLILNNNRVTRIDILRIATVTELLH